MDKQEFNDGVPAVPKMRTFKGDLSVKTIMETYCECCFGNVEPTQIRCNKETWRKLLHKMIDVADPRYGGMMLMRINAASVVYDPEVPEGQLHFDVPADNGRFGAILELDVESASNL